MNVGIWGLKDRLARHASVTMNGWLKVESRQLIREDRRWLSHGANNLHTVARRLALRYQTPRSKGSSPCL